MNFELKVYSKVQFRLYWFILLVKALNLC